MGQPILPRNRDRNIPTKSGEEMGEREPLKPQPGHESDEQKAPVARNLRIGGDVGKFTSMSRIAVLLLATLCFSLQALRRPAPTFHSLKRRDKGTSLPFVPC